MKKSQKNLPSLGLPARFRTPRRTLWIDRGMNVFIKLGGIGIILAVLGIFVFILSQVLPLFWGAEVAREKSLQLPGLTFRVLGIDEWGERPFAVTQDGEIYFADFKENSIPERTTLPSLADKTISTVQYNDEQQTIIFGTQNGEFSLVTVNYEADFSGNSRKIRSTLQETPFFSLGFEGEAVREIGFGGGDHKLIAAVIETGGRRLKAAKLEQSEDLLGEKTIRLGPIVDLTDQLQSPPESVRVSESGEVLLVSTEDGSVYYFQNTGADPNFLQLRQRFQPFAHGPNAKVAFMDFILGGNSVYLTNASGENVLYSLFIPEGGDRRLFGKIKSFPPLPGPVEFFSKSLRNKAFLVGGDDYASLRFATTEQVRWEEKLPFKALQSALTKKFHRIAFLDEQNRIHLYKLEDPHPETGWRSFFGKIWYEGASEPDYVWQSTGGSDNFEPKLSLVPLMVGTLKGTLYALLFAVPIALLAALYTSQFLHPNLRKVIKPTMEIMASLPSVILGFLAALWLAPLIEGSVPSLILVILAIPLATILFGFTWNQFPFAWRSKLPLGQEWLLLIPWLLVVSWGAWQLGPCLESWAFVITDPASGAQVADFRLWWPHVTGTSFEQRNSLVVGFIMGFAVIPIIFTISEDSLSAVPQTLRSGSLALGASRWQTAMRVILPAATAGIFSAIMIGFGRAVGETMIVLMATGNTPIMDFNIFSGMRTLSANLAVELPEAPFESTLYRTLFLGALLLFLMTFSVNSVAELMREKIRRRFKAL